jgi:hypothetical protein
MVTRQGYSIGTSECNKLCPAATGLSLVNGFPCLYRLRTVRCYGWYSCHKFIILSTYLLMGVGMLVTILLWVSALFRLTDWRQRKVEV